ncbi:MAG TPA: DinB family protein [Brachybacterium sp.]
MPSPSGVPVEDLDALVDRLAAEQQTPEPGTAGAGDGTAAAQGDAAAVGASRPEPPLLAGERETLEGFLDFLRATIRWKAEGLDDAQASRRLVSSETTVTGMLHHLADIERYWFREVLGGVPLEDVGYRWSDGHDTRREWSLAPEASLREALADYLAATDQSRAQLSGRDPEEELRGGNAPRTVRWVLTHMVEETARHAGQLDILVELLDGRTGE